MVECQLPKLDVAGSSPVSRSILSITYATLAFCGNPLFAVTGYADVQNPLKGIGLKVHVQRVGLDVTYHI